MFPIAANSDEEKLYSDDVFSTYLYTGNGSTQTITNGIDLAGKGGMVWTKRRNDIGDPYTSDTARGASQGVLLTDGTYSQFASSTAFVTSFNSNGFSIGNDQGINKLNDTYASWTFRKAAKFFDVVTYTGTGANRTIAHNLGIAPGMVIVKRTDTTGSWQVYSNGLTSAEYSIRLNIYSAQSSAPTVWNSTAPTSSVFSVGTDATVNASGGTYVAYLFAHDTASDGIIQCGSFTKTAGVDVDVALGWEPQYLFVKASNVTSDWEVYDSMRGFCAGKTGVSAFLNPNLSAAESSNSYLFGPTATGFSGYGNLTSATYIYMAIRRPNKPPTSGTQVFSPQAYTGNINSPRALTGVGFPVDLAIYGARSVTSSQRAVVSRLQGVSSNPASSWVLYTSSSQPEAANLYGAVGALNTQDGTVVYTGSIDYDWANSFGKNYIMWNFKRAPGFMDVVCYTGDGTTNRAVAHNLTVAPNMIIAKARSGVANWFVYVSPTGPSQGGFLNTNADWAAGGWTGNWFANTTPTASNFYISYNGDYGSTLEINNSGTTYVAYLFATLAGISKVGSYTGNGGTQNIDCGFAAGARFVLVKRTDSTGDWYTFDTARGIVTGNDPHLSLNTTAVEVTTDDSIDPYSAGFTVNQLSATNINVSSATYIFLAIA